MVKLRFYEISTSVGFVSFYWAQGVTPNGLNIYLFLSLPPLPIKTDMAILKGIEAFDFPLLDRVIPANVRPPTIIADELEFTLPFSEVALSSRWFTFALPVGKLPQDDIRDEIKNVIVTLRERVLDSINATEKRCLIRKWFDRLFTFALLSFEDLV